MGECPLPLPLIHYTTTYDMNDKGNATQRYHSSYNNPIIMDCLMVVEIEVYMDTYSQRVFLAFDSKRNPIDPMACEMKADDDSMCINCSNGIIP